MQGNLFTTKPGQFHRPDVVNNRLYVISAVFNQHRYRSRWQRYLEFKKMVLDAGAILVTIEAAFGERAFVLEKDHENEILVQVRTSQELWLKESLWNIAAQHLPHDAQYLAFMDGDMHPVRKDWVGETLHQLQHYPVVQMFSEVSYLGPDHQILNRRISFAERWVRGYDFTAGGKKIKNDIFFNIRDNNKDKKDYAYEWGPPGGGWAFRRKEFDELGGWPDFCILGSADWFAAAGMAGFMDLAIPDAYSPDFKRVLKVWGDRAVRVIRKNIGVVPGAILHYWHGKMADRRYGERESILKNNQFSPITDLKRNCYGVLQFDDDGSERMRLLKNQVASYGASRREDGVEL